MAYCQAVTSRLLNLPHHAHHAPILNPMCPSSCPHLLPLSPSTPPQKPNARHPPPPPKRRPLHAPPPPHPFSCTPASHHPPRPPERHNILPSHHPQLPLPSITFWLLNRALDCLDGALARHRNLQSELGGFLDLLGDFIVYALIPICVVGGNYVSQRGGGARR